MALRARRLTIDEIVQSSHWAWASSLGDGRPDLYYDGQRFWSWPEGQVRRPLMVDELPRDGWWHAPDCRCAACRD